MEKAQIFYAKDPGRFWATEEGEDGWEGGSPRTIEELRQTHTLLAVVDRPRIKTTEDDLEALYVQFQGENWSPRGEARALIEALGLHHTTMSVGDVVVLTSGDVDLPCTTSEAYVAAGAGFLRLPAWVGDLK